MNRAATPDWSLDPQLAGDSHPVAGFGLSELRLMDDANYPWLVLVPRAPEARDLIDLPREARMTLMDEIDAASRALQALFRPHKLNVAALGNVVAQLHVHIIARQLDDPAWPAPVWGRVQARAYEPEMLVQRVRALRTALGA
jgi:diadenosine tetraphosphate (Ap4A) HIT family hydrolase